jgi:hypothetical protein
MKVMGAHSLFGQGQQLAVLQTIPTKWLRKPRKPQQAISMEDEDE